MKIMTGCVSAAFAAISLVTIAPAAVAADATGVTHDLTVHTADGRDRTAHLYVPASLSENQRVPLLVALHGGTGWGKQFEFTSGYDRLADQHGFLVVYPDGIGAGPNADALRTWNGGVCCGRAAREGVDDVAFLRQLVETVSNDSRVDPDRVFATGHSNGMIMSYRLVCEAADVFVAAAGQAGTLGVDDCRPSRPVSLRHIHGSADTNLPIDGGVGTTGISGVDFPSPRAGIRSLAAADGCPRAPVTKRAGPATRQIWRPCDRGTTIEFVTVQDANHAWMGSTAVRPGAPTPFPDYDSSTASWEFLAAHPRVPRR